MTKTAYDLSEPPGLQSGAAKGAWDDFVANVDDDVYGSVMQFWFPVCGELWYRGEDIPPSWGYSAGASNGRDSEDADLSELLQETPTADLLAMGERLEALYEQCKANGDRY